MYDKFTITNSWIVDGCPCVIHSWLLWRSKYGNQKFLILLRLMRKKTKFYLTWFVNKMKQRQIQSLQKLFGFWRSKAKKWSYVEKGSTKRHHRWLNKLCHFIINDIITSLHLVALHAFHFGTNTIVSYVQLINTIFIIFEIIKLGL